MFPEEPVEHHEQRGSEDTSDADPENSDLSAGDHAERTRGRPRTYELTRRTRSRSALARDAAAPARSETARTRDAAAERRDLAAAERDAAARDRDTLAAALDAEIDELEKSEPVGGDGSVSALEILMRAVRDRKRAAASRARATAQRRHAEHDRKLAQADRREAAEDRRAAAAEFAAEGIDDLTGALRRRVGLAAMQRELDRTARTGEPLVVAFVDVDGLKAVNDTRGHSAGDELLRDVVRCIKSGLRSYDIVLRYGGDELVCSLAGEGMHGIGDRFARISSMIADCQPGASISCGFAQHGPDEALVDLIRRADSSLLASRMDHNSPR